MKANCEICKSLDTGNRRLLVTDHWIVTVAPDQGYLGRCYVSLRRHRQHLRELNSAEWNDLTVVVGQLEHAITAAFGATLYNWACMMNNAYQDANPVPHVHWHLRPRYSAPVIFNGIEYSDKDFGHHYDRDQRTLLDASVVAAITAEIKSKLST